MAACWKSICRADTRALALAAGAVWGGEKRKTQVVFCEPEELWHEGCEMGPGWGRCAGGV